MGAIFINYRTEQARTFVGALTERLTRHFGADQVFVDFQMEPGTRYPDQLRDALLDSDVVVVVIRERWTDEFARSRPKDWVRFEIATALAKGIPLLPVLLEQADLPTRQELPDDIAELASLQVTRVHGETIGPDIDHIVRLLERHLAPTDAAPPEPGESAKPKRVGRRIVAWAAALFLVTPILFLADPDSLEEWFYFAAFVSAVLLAATSVLTTFLVLVVKPLVYRWDAEAGTIPLREVMSRRWLLPALGLLPSVFFLSKVGPGDDGVWQEWEVWYVVVLVLIGLFFVHRMWRRYNARDYVWPPPVSMEPAVFRRAAHRLHEKLTTDPEWRAPRSRVKQREAVAVYLSIAGVRLELLVRARKPLFQWLKTGYSGEITAYLGWLTSIVCLDVVAVALFLDSPTARQFLLVGATVAAAVFFTAAKVAVEFYSDRRDVRRWVDELTERQNELGPLVFCGSCHVSGRCQVK